ncbi:DoxX family protein [Sulfoacidibacillus ferrooxidans]|uniref:DoxX family protein n=1 Tax=Sulfoacidibacillus ferrooxidans TaxID=2005001 RepID=A0A9X1VB56_9BACL|nr:hypothetical protein [Sulfoacidibacillus ferrooxidans]
MSSTSRYAPIIIRLVLGITFIIHGFLKLSQPTGFVKYFAHIAVPVLRLIEFLGGISLIVGIDSKISPCFL